MDQYHDLVKHVLTNGTHEDNRTDVGTIATFGYDYEIDVSKGYPLLTTKKMDTFRWDSMLHEVEWYLSGKHHIRDLTEKTGIWDAWSDDSYNLPSAYGRFWRRYPVPDAGQLPGESWVSQDSSWTQVETTVETRFRFDSSEEDVLEKTQSMLKELGDSLLRTRLYIDAPQTHTKDGSTYVAIPVRVVTNRRSDVEDVADEINDNLRPESVRVGESYLTFDQLKFNVDALKGDNPHRDPNSRRLIVNAWNPANAQASELPPCHYTYVFNVQDRNLNLHLKQRSADIALGVPFNIAAYALILKLVAQESGYSVGTLRHTLTDAHAYTGKRDRDDWYADNVQELRGRVEAVTDREEYSEVRDWVLSQTPDEDATPDEHNYGYDHVPGLLEQLSRTPKERPELHIDEGKTIDSVAYRNFELDDYDSFGGLRFNVAE